MNGNVIALPCQLNPNAMASKGAKSAKATVVVKRQSEGGSQAGHLI
jgi:hypothetical protein